MEKSSGIRPIGSQPKGHNGSFGWTSDKKSISYPQCVQCGQKHPGDCSTMTGRCYVIGVSIGGGSVHTWARVVITIMGKDISERIVLGGQNSSRPNNS